MTKSLKITVWNAAQHVLKVGHKKLVLHPGNSLVVEKDDQMNDLIESGKLVILDVQAEIAPITEEPTKKKKKEVVETSIEESAENNSDVESAEDLILPEEVD